MDFYFSAIGLYAHHTAFLHIWEVGGVMVT